MNSISDLSLIKLVKETKNCLEMVRKISLDRISSTLGHSSANMDLLYETRVLLCTTWLAFVGVVVWLVSIGTDYWVIVVGKWLFHLTKGLILISKQGIHYTGETWLYRMYYKKKRALIVTSNENHWIIPIWISSKYHFLLFFFAVLRLFTVFDFCCIWLITNITKVRHFC